MKLLAPFISLGMVLVFIIICIIMTKQDNNKKTKSDSSVSQTSQKFINIMDIQDNILYGLDGYKRIFIELEGICIDLLNKNDINRLIKGLSSDIAKLNLEFDLFAISRPFNIEMLKNQYEEEILNAKTDIQRTLLRNSLRQIMAFGENGEVVERKFYLIVQGQENEAEIEKQADLLIESFKSSNITCYRLKDAEIKRLINLFNNITTYNYDDMSDIQNSIPVIKEDLEKKKSIDEKLKEKLEIEKKEQEEINRQIKQKEEEKKKQDLEQIETIKETKNKELLPAREVENKNEEIEDNAEPIKEIDNNIDTNVLDNIEVEVDEIEEDL